jgi:hypothetical protein
MSEMQLQFLMGTPFQPLPGGSAHYVAALQTKPGELDALGRATEDTWSRLTPLIQIVGPKSPREQINADNITTWTGHISDAVGQHAIFLDILRLKPTHPVVTGGGVALPVLERIYWSARKRSLTFVPVFRVGESSAAYAKMVTDAAHCDGRGLALRLPIRSLAPPPGMTVTDHLSAVLSRLHADVDATDLLLDMGFIEPETEIYADDVARKLVPALKVGKWRSVALLGTSIPSMLSCIPEGTVGAIKRQEWEVWTGLSRLGLDRLPAFGDYAISTPLPRRMAAEAHERTSDTPLHQQPSLHEVEVRSTRTAPNSTSASPSRLPAGQNFRDRHTPGETVSSTAVPTDRWIREASACGAAPAPPITCASSPIRSCSSTDGKPLRGYPRLCWITTKQSVSDDYLQRVQIEQREQLAPHSGACCAFVRESTETGERGMDLITPQEPHEDLRVDAMVGIRLAHEGEARRADDTDDEYAPPGRQYLHRLLNVALGEHDGAPIEDTSICLRLAGQPFQRVAFGLDLEAVDGCANNRDVGPLVSSRHPKLVDSFGCRRSDRQHLLAQRVSDNSLGHHLRCPIRARRKERSHRSGCTKRGRSRVGW